MVKKIDLLILGSGPSGVTVARQLIRAGLKVTLLDNGYHSDPKVCEVESHETLWDFRTKTSFLPTPDDKKQEKRKSNQSPKFSVRSFFPIYRDFSKLSSIKAEGMKVVGSHAVGGLSNIWGAGCPTLHDTLAKNWPFGKEELIRSYNEVAPFIGLSGEENKELFSNMILKENLQKPLELAAPMRLAFEKYSAQNNSDADKEFFLARANNAVSSEKTSTQSGCSYCGACLYGCKQNSIFNSAYSIKELKKSGLVKHISGKCITSLSVNKSGHYKLYGFDSSSSNRTEDLLYETKTLFLAAGTITTNLLIHRLLNNFDKVINLHVHPSQAFAFVAPQLLGSSVEKNFFALSGLNYSLKENTDEIAFGTLFSAMGISAEEFIQRLKFSRPTATQITKFTQPAMVLANCYLNQRLANVELRIKENSAEIHGEFKKEFRAVANYTKNKIIKNLRKFGLYYLPGTSKIAQLGSDAHIIGGLVSHKNRKRPILSKEGNLIGHPGIWIADGSAIYSTGNRNPTFTIMAWANTVAKCFLREKKEKSG